MTTRRRAFLAQGAAAVGAAGLIGATAGAQPADVTRWQPAREAKDNWLDLPGKHRLFFDAISAQGAGDAAHFAGNYYAGNKADYGLEPKDLAVVIGLRHFATPFAFGDAIWAKYGASLGDAIKVKDPRTGEAPARNIRKASYDELIAFGAHFAVCDMATHVFARSVARKAGSSENDVYKEMIANAIANVHIMSAGIIAVNRAQERGYSVAYVG